MCIETAECANDLGRVAADPEEPDPTPKVRVDPRDAVGNRPSPGSRRELPDLGRHAVERPLRWQHFDLGGLPITAQAEADEVPVLGPGDSALVCVHLEAKAPLDEAHDRG